MITKNDWNDALDAWVEEERERLGGPPSPEEVVAYVSGALAPPDAARVRALLVYYPEMTDLLDERIEAPRAPWRSEALRFYAIAATFVIAVLTGVIVQQQREITRPVVHSSRYTLTAFHSRGTAPVQEMIAGERQYRVVAIPSKRLTESHYDVEIRRGTEVLWRERDVAPLDNAFDITIPGRFLRVGQYKLDVYSGEDRRLIVSYPFRVVMR